MSFFLEEMEYEPSDWDKANNPLLMEWIDAHVPLVSHSKVMKAILEGKAHKSPSDEFMTRTACIGKYGFAIPTEEVLREILALSPKGIVEIGAGSGYWAALLRKLGGDVIACDDGSGLYAFKVGAFGNVEKVDYKKLLRTDASCKDRTLLTVWPAYDNAEIFDRYKGETVVYVGEIGDGCTQYDPAIEKTWKMVKEIRIPTWSCIHDSVGIFRRKG